MRMTLRIKKKVSNAENLENTIGSARHLSGVTVVERDRLALILSQTDNKFSHCSDL